MSTTYGEISLHFSDDCIYDEDKLIAALNKFQWTRDGDAWHMDQYGNIQYGSCKLIHPTLYADMIVTAILDRDGGEVEIPYDELTSEDIGDIVDYVLEDYDLGNMVKLISPAIEQGSIELICRYSNPKLELNGLEGLKIFSEARGEIRQVRIGGKLASEPSLECYP
jgi:hypothetical protein